MFYLVPGSQFSQYRQHIGPHIDAGFLCRYNAPVFFYQDMPIFCNYCLMVLIQFILGLSILLFVIFASQCMTCFASLPSSNRKTRSNHFSLFSSITSSDFYTVSSPDFLMSTSSFQEMSNRRMNLRCVVWDFIVLEF